MLPSPSLVVLRRILDNVLTSGEEKHCCLKESSQTFQQHLAPYPDAIACLRSAGFRRQEDGAWFLDPAALDAVRSTRASLFVDCRNNEVAEDLEARCKRYQRSVHRCSHCTTVIIDGSERAWTGDHTAPMGQYRYTCSTCVSGGVAKHLCEKCFDAHARGNSSVHPGCARPWFEATPPVNTKHGAHAAADGAAADSRNQWGASSARPSAAMYAKLYTRHGF